MGSRRRRVEMWGWCVAQRLSVRAVAHHRDQTRSAGRVLSESWIDIMEEWVVTGGRAKGLDRRLWLCMPVYSVGSSSTTASLDRAGPLGKWARLL